MGTASATSGSAAVAGGAQSSFRLRVGSLLTLAGYLLAALCLYLAWSVRQQNLIHAGDGLGYWLGVAGASLMGLLLLYPLRKRARSMRRLGPVSVWFRVHMVFGVVGPLLIVLHSNFALGSFNGRIAMYATLIVAGSGIVGRYIYAKLHHGLYGRKATLEELQRNLEVLRDGELRVSGMVAELVEELAAYETRLLHESAGLVGTFRRAITVAPRTFLMRLRIARRTRAHLARRARTSAVLAEHQRRLQHASDRYVRRRIAALRKYAQFRAFQKLFSLWHIVHYPLFVILVFAAIIHVFAVHMY